MTLVVAVDHRFEDLSVEIDLLHEVGATVRDARGLEREAALEMCAEAEVILVGARFRFDAEAISRLSRCKAIIRYGIGYDNIDLDAATASRIWVAYVPDYCIEEVADHAIALLLTMNRHILGFDRAIREGNWGVPDRLQVRRLSSCVTGVIGFGRVGEAFARRALSLGMRVLASDPLRPEADMTALGVEPSEINALLSAADFVSLHAPPPETGIPLLGATELARLKLTACLINVGRAALVDETALLTALESGKLAGAALDVTATEPLHPPHPLLDSDRILLTPHAAWYSLEAVADLRRRVAEEAVRVIEGGSPVCAANQPE